ncbi:MAG: hypothetical protein Q9M26_04555 [Mariprofundales bacterium]|nr:hypothetical protein [Mariprofundales bacterium]
MVGIAMQILKPVMGRVEEYWLVASLSVRLDRIAKSCSWAR